MLFLFGIEHNLLVDLFFFFQAEDGIRDRTVTGVQTCALPIFTRDHLGDSEPRMRSSVSFTSRSARSLSSRRTARNVRPPMRAAAPCAAACNGFRRSEERRVGKECRSRGWPQR